MTEKTIRRYCRAVGSYLPCARRQKRQLLRDLRQRLEEYRDEHPDETSPSASERRSRWRQAMWMTWIPQSCCRPCVTGGV